MLCARSPKSVHYSEIDKKNLAGALNITGVEILSNSIFVRHGHLQGIGAYWNRGHEQRDQTNVIPKGPDLKDLVVVAYDDSLSLDRGSCKRPIFKVI